MSQSTIVGEKQHITGEPALKVLFADRGSLPIAVFEELLRKIHPDAQLVTESTIEAAVEALSRGGFDIAFIGLAEDSEDWLEMIGIGPTIAPKTAIFGMAAHHDRVMIERALEAGALDHLTIDGMNSALLGQAIRYGVNRKRFEERLRAGNDQMVRNLIDLRDAKERAEAQGAAYIEVAEELSSAKGRLERALVHAEESERRYRILSDSSPVGIWQIDLDGRTIYMNRSIKSVLEIVAEADGAEITLADVVLADDSEKIKKALQQWADGHSGEVEVRVVGRRTAQQHYMVMSGVTLPASSDTAAILVTAVDITQRKEAEAAMQHMAHHDALTGLPNRTLFVDRLQQVLHETARRGGFMAVLFLDLDHFKDVNDTLGHPVGDKLLMEVSERLLTCVRETDTVARLGGDEFAILCTNLTNPEQAAELAQRIVAMIRKSYNIMGQEIFTATSIGISIFPTDAKEADKLVSFADMALYTAKESGRSNYHFFDQKMDDAVQRRKALENELRESLASNHFTLHYQPQVDLHNSQIIGAEALLRWNHPTRGMIYPGEFIPIAEQCGLISPLGQWVIQAAFIQAKAWQDELPMPVRVAINLSAVQFRQKNLVQRIRDLIHETGVDPELLEFEITESMLMENTDQAIAAMRGLTDLGFGLSIDDFGTGFSSLAYLKKFPVDSLKIDRSFVSDVINDSEDATIASSIIQLAHSLSMKVVAEGVENQGQASFLVGEKCDFGQGYFYGRPMAADEFISLFSNKTGAVAGASRPSMRN